MTSPPRETKRQIRPLTNLRRRYRYRLATPFPRLSSPALTNRSPRSRRKSRKSRSLKAGRRGTIYIGCVHDTTSAISGSWRKCCETARTIQRTLSGGSDISPGTHAKGSPVMAKGQMRSNREVKKPKQDKKSAPATSPTGAPPIRVTPASSATTKKH
jgi:hypothetical protein